MAISVPALKLFMARFSKETWLWLLSIGHESFGLDEDEMPNKLRYVRNNQDIVSGGYTFNKSDFVLVIPGAGDKAGRARLAMPNVSRAIGQALG